MAESETAGPSPTLRSSRDDKSGGRRPTVAVVDVDGQSLTWAPSCSYRVLLTNWKAATYLSGSGRGWTESHIGTRPVPIEFANKLEGGGRPQQ